MKKTVIENEAAVERLEQLRREMDEATADDERLSSNLRVALAKARAGTLPWFDDAIEKCRNDGWAFFEDEE